MSPLLSILRAAHCRSTHHYFAIDSLRMVQTDAGVRLRGILLKHHERYLIGTKDPDVRFRDFHNHVIHVQDGYFGGAPRVAMMWYGRLMGHLAASRWDDAAYAMGVLSHYFTDPLMPLHTAQSEREALVHRPMEWSVCKSYDRILKRWTEDELRLVFQLGDGEGWLGEAILKGARFANRSYKRLVDEYDVDLGVENPVAGLNEASIATFAELFGLAITGLARIIERVAYEAETRCGTQLPKFSLTLPAVLATLQIPEQWWLRRIESREEREAIDAIIAEYRKTGKVVKSIPSEIYIKQRVLQIRASEAAWNMQRRELAIQQGAQTAQFVVQENHLASTAPRDATLESINQDSITHELDAASDVVVSIPFATGLPASDSTSSGSDKLIQQATASQSPPARLHSQSRISRSDDLVDAPSIGPKTASAFAEINIFKIGEFLDTPANAMARRLMKTWITPSVIQDWQAQTTLMCDVPGLLSRDVQMLVGVGVRSSEALAQADAKALTAKMKVYASSSDGRRSLRGAPPAEVVQVANWIAAAGTQSRSRRAA